MEHISIIPLPNQKIRPFKQLPDLEIDDHIVLHPMSKDYQHVMPNTPMLAKLSDIANDMDSKVRCQFTGEYILRHDPNTKVLPDGGFYRSTDRYGENKVELLDYENFNAADWCIKSPEPAKPTINKPYDGADGVSLATILGHAIAAAPVAVTRRIRGGYDQEF